MMASCIFLLSRRPTDRSTLTFGSCGFLLKPCLPSLLCGNVLATNSGGSKLKTFSLQIIQIFSDHELIGKTGSQEKSLAKKSGQW